MSADDATTATVRVLLRRADEQTLSKAAHERKQSLASFLSETLAVVAVDLRQPPRPAITWLDVYSRRADLAPDTSDDGSEIQWCEPRPPRRVCLPTGPTPAKR